MVADIEELEKMDASDIYARRLNSVNAQKMVKHLYSRSQMEQSTNLEESGTVQTEEENKEIFQENQTSLHHKTHHRVTMTRRMISGQFQETAFTVLYVPTAIR